MAAIFSFSPANAASNDDAKILIHLASVTTKNMCSRSEARPPCSEIVTAGRISTPSSPQSYFAYVLVADGDASAGVAGTQLGIRYDNESASGIDIFAWTNCATLEFPSPGWPASQTGTLLTWDALQACQRFEPGGDGLGVCAVAGYFYCAAYDNDTLSVIPRPVDGKASVADCSSKEYTLVSEEVVPDVSPLGYAVFTESGSVEGYNPCGYSGLTPVWIMDVDWDSTTQDTQRLNAKARITSNNLARAESTFPASNIMTTNYAVSSDAQKESVDLAMFNQLVWLNSQGEIVNEAPLLSRPAVASSRSGTVVSLGNVPGLESARTIDLSRYLGRKATNEFAQLHVDDKGLVAVAQWPKSAAIVNLRSGVSTRIPFQIGEPRFSQTGVVGTLELNNRKEVRVAIRDSDGKELFASPWTMRDYPVKDLFIDSNGHSAFYMEIHSNNSVLRNVNLRTGESRVLNNVNATGRRWFSDDGRFLLIVRHDEADSLHYWNLTNIETPVLLWSISLDQGRILFAADVSPSGRYMAYQLIRSNSRFGDLYVLDMAGELVGANVHNEDFLIRGVQFASDWQLFEGIDPRVPLQVTRRVLLYELPRR